MNLHVITQKLKDPFDMEIRMKADKCQVQTCIVSLVLSASDAMHSISPAFCQNKNAFFFWTEYIYICILHIQI